MRVPFLDLAAAHRPIRGAIDAAIAAVIDENAFAGGPFVARFEEEFAAYCGARHAIAVGNGTDALWLALLAMDIGAGDEVITVSNTFAATVEAIHFTGAKPVLIDVRSDTLLMDPALIEAAITPQTKAIIPVHLFGQIAAMPEIMSIARKHGLRVVEDACQAHGAMLGGSRAGSLGDAGCFSFYPGKNLGAFGEAGAVVTDDEAIAARIRSLRDHGQSQKYHHAYVGWNARMDGIQAAVLRTKLPLLDVGNAARRNHALRYLRNLSGNPRIIIPSVPDMEAHAFHLFPVLCDNRDAVLSTLQAEGIGCGIHYPVPVHLQPGYSFLGYKEGSLPVSEASARRLLSLPMYPELEAAQIDWVCERLQAILAPTSARESR